MTGEIFTRKTVLGLMNSGYQVITNGKPEKVEIDLWDYILMLGDDDSILVLEDLLSWTDRQLSLISKAA